MRRRPSRSLTSGGRGGSASHSATGPGSQPGCSAASKCSASQRVRVTGRELDLAVAVEQHDGGARRRVGGERADEAPARLRGSQRVLEPGAGEVEHVAVALGELALGAAEAATTASPRPVRMPIAISYSTPAAWSRSPYSSLRVKGPALDELGQPHGGAPAGRVRGQQRVVRRAPDDRLEGAGGLRLGRERLVVDGARGELDPIPREDVRGDELGERMERASPQLGLCRERSTIARANPYAAPTSVSASQGMASPANILLGAILTGNELDVDPATPVTRRCVRSLTVEAAAVVDPALDLEARLVGRSSGKDVQSGRKDRDHVKRCGRAEGGGVARPARTARNPAAAACHIALIHGEPQSAAHALLERAAGSLGEHHGPGVGRWPSRGVAARRWCHRGP